MRNERRGGLLRFRCRIAIGLLVIMLCTPSLSLGWGAGGHMIVASIAYKQLNPTAKAKVNELLAIQIAPAEVTAESIDFVNAAHWADDIRSFPEVDKYKGLHFIDIPFSNDGTPLPKVPTPNIVTALQDQVKVLQTSTDKNEQALALRLIIHFVGDIHQPLHCATRVDGTHPKGDFGGNRLTILISGSGAEKPRVIEVNLHSYWDGGIDSFPKTGPGFTPPSLEEIPGAVAKALVGNPATNPALKLNAPFDFMAWAKESNNLAQGVAYKNITDGERPSAAYKAASLKVVRQRVAWGGYRLAALLNAIWP